MVTETFLLSAITIIAGLLSATIAVCYKSKCSHIRCCCFDVERDTTTELKEDLAQINAPVNNNV